MRSEPKQAAPEPANSLRGVRADAQRNIDLLLETAKAVFTASGVDAPVREIAARAGVGIGTLYRHFPQRSDLIAAVFRREVDTCVAAAEDISKENPPAEALSKWLWRYTDFIATKRGLAAALRSGDAAFDGLPAYFEQHLGPVLQALLDSAAAAGQVRADIRAYDLLRGLSNLCVASGEDGPAHSRRMVALLIDGLRYIPASADAARSSAAAVTKATRASTVTKSKPAKASTPRVNAPKAATSKGALSPTRRK